MKYVKKPVVVEAITFEELVEYGKAHTTNIIRGMPWSFEYKGHPITHENDECYLIPTLEGTMKFNKGDMLITGVKGEIYPCKPDIFQQTYEAAGTTMTTNENRASCAHLEVSYFTVRNRDGSTHGWWQCDQCEIKFVPDPMQWWTQAQPPPDALEGALLTDDEQAQILETYRDWSDYAKAEAVAQAQLAKATRIIEQRVLDAVRAELLDDYLPRSSESADAFIANAKKRLAGDKG